MLVSLNGFRCAIEEAFRGHRAPLADVIEGEHVYHDAPGLKGAPIQVQVAWQVSGEGLHQVVQPTP